MVVLRQLEILRFYVYKRKVCTIHILCEESLSKVFHFLKVIIKAIFRLTCKVPCLSYPKIL